jgi:hypothetical protein
MAAVQGHYILNRLRLKEHSPGVGLQDLFEVYAGKHCIDGRADEASSPNLQKAWEAGELAYSNGICQKYEEVPL